MKRRIRVLCGLLPVLALAVAVTAVPAAASAHKSHHHRHHRVNRTNQSDASVDRALSPYKARLTVDIIYLVSQSQRNPPSASQAGSVDSHLAGVQRDLNKVQRVAQAQRPSSSSTRRALSDIERALSDVYAAASQERVAVSDVRKHRIGAARSAMRAATADLTRAIPLLSSGGKALHLFG